MRSRLAFYETFLLLVCHSEDLFAAHPARIAGTVVDTRGNAVRAPWILVVAADGTRRQEWATTSAVAQGDTIGRFSLPAR